MINETKLSAHELTVESTQEQFNDPEVNCFKVTLEELLAHPQTQPHIVGIVEDCKILLDDLGPKTR